MNRNFVEKYFDNIMKVLTNETIFPIFVKSTFKVHRYLLLLSVLRPNLCTRSHIFQKLNCSHFTKQPKPHRQSNEGREKLSCAMGQTHFFVISTNWLIFLETISKHLI